MTTTNSALPANHHVRIEKQQNGEYALQEYHGDEHIQTISEHRSYNAAVAATKKEEFEHPLVDLRNVELGGMLSYLPKADEEAIQPPTFGPDKIPVAQGDVIASVTSPGVAYELVVEPKQSGVVTYRVRDGEYDWIPREILRRDINSDEGCAKVLIKDGYQQLLHTEGETADIPAYQEGHDHRDTQMPPNHTPVNYYPFIKTLYLTLTERFNGRVANDIIVELGGHIGNHERDYIWPDDDTATAETQQQRGEEAVRVTFHPQQWDEHLGEERAVEADDASTVTFIVPTDQATTEDGQLVDDDSRESDLLREHEEAPSWVNEWSGPFYITTEFCRAE